MNRFERRESARRKLLAIVYAAVDGSSRCDVDQLTDLAVSKGMLEEDVEEARHWLSQEGFLFTYLQDDAVRLTQEGDSVAEAELRKQQAVRTVEPTGQGNAVSRIDLERLMLAEQLRFNLEQARIAQPVQGMFGGMGWDFMDQAHALVTQLSPSHAEYFAIHHGSEPRSEKLFAESLLLFESAFAEVAREAYALPKRTGTHREQLDSIMVDANEVIPLAIIVMGNKSPYLRDLIRNLYGQLRQTLGTGSELSEGAEDAVREVLHHLGEIFTKLDQAPLAGREGGALLIEANKHHGEMGKALKKVTKEFRNMRDEEKKVGRGGDTFNIGSVQQLVKGDHNTNTANQTAGASLAEVAALLRELREQVQNLPPQSRQDAIDCIEAVEAEAKVEKPSSGKLRGFLAGIREAAETGGATAETVAKIVSLTQKLGPLLLPLAAAALGGG